MQFRSFTRGYAEVPISNEVCKALLVLGPSASAFAAPFFSSLVGWTCTRDGGSSGSSLVSSDKDLNRISTRLSKPSAEGLLERAACVPPVEAGLLYITTYSLGMRQRGSLLLEMRVVP